MPYTPPASRSPASSAPTSPDASRRSSLQSQNGLSRPSLPRSSSYLTRHRRTPSAVGANAGFINQPTPESTSDDLKGMVSSSIRQSPPPVTDDRSMPTGAVISPPESASSSDDELPEVRGRRIQNLKELHDAISQIPQHRSSSPNKGSGGTDTVDLPISTSQADKIAEVMHHSFSASSLDDLAHARRVSRGQSASESNVACKSAENSLTASEEESEGEIRRKPPMVRKKSGELVRPALRPPACRRPSSMPGTPTFSKAVHFDSHLEHVRHFLQVDRPLAVSAGSSPIDNYDSDTEYPFNEERSGSRTPPYEWEIIINNFPADTPIRKAMSVRLERVWLSNDHKFLIGSVAVANIAFQKYVTCRFTLDYWKTTSEVAGEYMSEIRPNEGDKPRDRFNFTIKLADLANLESKTLFFAVRYNVNGQEFWDNNGGTNFQVDFRKKMLPQNGKKGVIGASSRPANSLPRSNHRRPNPSTVPRPKSMPSSFDEFSDNPKVNFDQSIHDYLGETEPAPLRLKSTKSAAIPSDNLPSRLSTPSGQAFANRYDFEASLQAAKGFAAKPDGFTTKPARRPTPAPAATTAKPSPKASTATTIPKEASRTEKNALSAIPGAGSPASATITSSTYEEIVNKYCFFGSKQSSPQLKDGTLGGRLDGCDDILTTRPPNGSVSSSDESPVTFGSLSASGSRKWATSSADADSYFEHLPHLNTLGASPSTSSLGNPINRLGSPFSPSRSPTSVSGQSTGRSTSPASLVGSFQPFTSTSPNEFASYMHDRFPFSGTDAHNATAIKG